MSGRKSECGMGATYLCATRLNAMKMQRKFSTIFCRKIVAAPLRNASRAARALLACAPMPLDIPLGGEQVSHPMRSFESIAEAAHDDIQRVTVLFFGIDLG